MKDDSEADPYFSPNDVFPSFETWDRFNLFTNAAKKPGMLQYEIETKLKANPFQFGIIGSTDAHTSVFRSRSV